MLGLKNRRQKMPKKRIIVTHINPDLDGIPAIWLLRKYDPEYKDAEIRFVPAGSRYVDGDPELITHVDTGGGEYDHHNTDDFTCAAKLVWEDLKKRFNLVDEAMDRMIEVITEYDHARENLWPEPNSDRYDFSLHAILTGWKMLNPNKYYEYLEWTIPSLEAIHKVLTEKVVAENLLKEGKEFESPWGKAVVCETYNDSVLDIGMKHGYALVIRKDPVKGFVRITGSTPHGVDLTKAYESIVELDPTATWFLHASKVLLRNGSSRNPTMKPTKLSLEKIIELINKSK